jgi:hypothetical protein
LVNLWDVLVQLRRYAGLVIALSEILRGQAGAAFIREECEGDPEVAAAAFALVHSPRSRD